MSYAGSIYCNSWAQNCTWNCCDIWGDCPFLPTGCSYPYDYYYYNSGSVLSSKTAIGIGVGVSVFVLLIITIIIIYYCRRRRQMMLAGLVGPTMETTTVVMHGGASMAGPAPMQMNTMNPGMGMGMGMSPRAPMFVEPTTVTIGNNGQYNPWQEQNRTPQPYDPMNPVISQQLANNF